MEGSSQQRAAFQPPPAASGDEEQQRPCANSCAGVLAALCTSSSTTSTTHRDSNSGPVALRLGDQNEDLLDSFIVLGNLGLDGAGLSCALLKLLVEVKELRL